jgi:hypothetical protein
MESTWRPLGQLLIERGLIDEYELEYWLKQQKLTGMLLGELLVLHRVVPPAEVAAALAIQRGSNDVADRIHESPRLLGRILVERGLITESGLQRVLLAQQRNGGSVGDILVARGWVTAEQLAEALAEQGGLAPLVEAEETAEESSAAEMYEVRSPATAADALYVSDAFLDATDFAFDLIDAEEPDELEIVRVASGEREQVWAYSREASERFRAETADSRPSGA